MNKYLKLHICFKQVLRHTGTIWKWKLKEKLSGFFLFSLRIGKVEVASLLMHGSCHMDTQTSLSKAGED